MLEEHLELAGSLVEAADFVQDAFDRRVVVREDDGFSVDVDGNEVVGCCCSGCSRVIVVRHG